MSVRSFKINKLKKKEPIDGNGRVICHPLFCQINELYLNRQKNLIWRETGRCLKFLELVEEGSGHWSKPHVATISLRVMIELRNLIANGTVFLNYESKNFKKTIQDLSGRMIEDYTLDPNLKDRLVETLLLPSINQCQRDYYKQLNVGDRQHFPCVASSKTKNLDESSLNFDISNDIIMNTRSSLRLSKESLNDKEKTDGHNESDDESISIDLESVNQISQILASDYKRNQDFAKKIPSGSKTCNILIGEVDYLHEEKFIVGLIKFSQPILLQLTEVPIQSKYIFVLLGAKGNIIKYREIGRCVATLFSDEIFQNDVHLAKEKADILQGIDEFLDHSTVLPAGQWDTSTRLPPPAKVPSREERLVLKMIKVKKDKPHQGGHEDDPCLTFTGKFCGGLIQDLKRKIPWYPSDFTDAFNFQCIPAIAFLYFACLSPIITFGGLLGYATDNYMGAIESLLSGLICGVAYSLFAGQPLTIMGSTGPVLVFETILNSFSKAYGIDYIGFRCYVGLWCAVILLIITFTDLSFLVKYITRFTEELFAILIALIFVNESIVKLLDIRKTHKFTNNPYKYKDFDEMNNSKCFRCVREIIHDGVNQTGELHEFDLNHSIIAKNENDCEKYGKGYVFLRECNYIPDVFFFSVILYFCTFLMALALRNIKFSSFFPTVVRSKLANFGVVLTIGTMVFFDYMVGLDTPKLMVPSEFHPTIPNRGWFINPFTRNREKWWLVFAAIPPAFLGAILVFLDQHITAVIVNRKGNKLVKSGGYHLDLLICALCIAVNSLFGLPWFVAATVLSMNHIIALRKISSSTVPGEAPKLIGVIEQRVTGTVIFILIGCSIFFTKYLSYIPMPVLYAIFMYMGVTPMGELEFYQRMLLILMPKKHQPDLVYLRQVKLSRVHLFTAIQIVCLIILFILKNSKVISITLPLMVLSLLFIRFGLNFVFTEKELSFLDDIIPGTGSKRRKKLSLKEVDVDVLEKVTRTVLDNRKLTDQLNEVMHMGESNININNEEILKKRLRETVRIKNGHEEIELNESLIKKTNGG